MLSALFLEDLFEQDLDDYLLIECFYLQAFVPKNQIWILVINSNNLPLYSNSQAAMEFVKRIYSYHSEVSRAEDIVLRKKLALVNKHNYFGFLLYLESDKIEIIKEMQVLEMIENISNPFRWELVQNLA